MTAVQHVAVVGAGITGLATAIALARGGVEVDIIEASEELTTVGSGISLQANALQAFAHLGVWDQVRREGYPFDGLVLRLPGPGADVISRREEPTGASDMPSAMGIPRAALARVLFDRAIALGARGRFGMRAAGVEQRAGAASVRVGEELIGTYDLVIGADGLHSAVRESIGIEAGPEPTGMGIWRAFVGRPSEVTTTELYYGGPAYIAGYTPTSQSSMYAFLVFDTEKRFQTPPDEAARIMAERSLAYSGPWEAIRADLAGGAAVNYTWFTSHLLDAPWHVDRAVVIGDAAHSCPPTIAQGAAQSLEDAVSLTDLLLSAERLDESMWEEFYRRRVGRARAVVDASMQLAEWQRDGEDHSHEMPELIAGLGRRLAESA